jgi:hypothetical protein
MVRKAGLAVQSGALKRLSAGGEGGATPHHCATASFQMLKVVAQARIAKSAAENIVSRGWARDRDAIMRSARAIAPQSTGMTSCSGLVFNVSSIARSRGSFAAASASGSIGGAEDGASQACQSAARAAMSGGRMVSWG